ncbi:hypothetical protein CLV51_1011613 [Chitinophaga niastensis]|uniref:Uncharacterized protein n=1 Tax=Chitinophaga niastensis TaxID=536980 RepID=A0A2P8HVL3_CHINA|nr:hypothetical protein [Chitinophaga niastensis]PSL50269.1 hypothetical protein CLV51_1011613 [Chitinophaga niastensis]
MPIQSKYHIGIQVDKLTNSIVNTISGDSFETETLAVSQQDLKNINKNNHWNFNWKVESKIKDRQVYKLTIEGNPHIIQGLISISDLKDHFYLHLIESAPFNMGKPKLYEGVPGNLFAFTCKKSFEHGYEGFVSFTSKTRLMAHYESALGAKHIGNHKMIIFPDAAAILINKYFKQ